MHSFCKNRLISHTKWRNVVSKFPFKLYMKLSTKKLFHSNKFCFPYYALKIKNESQKHFVFPGNICIPILAGDTEKFSCMQHLCWVWEIYSWCFSHRYAKWSSIKAIDAIISLSHYCVATIFINIWSIHPLSWGYRERWRK